MIALFGCPLIVFITGFLAVRMKTFHANMTWYGRISFFLSLGLFIFYFVIPIPINDENGEPSKNHSNGLLYWSGVIYCLSVFLIDVKMIVIGENSLFGGVERKDDEENSFADEDYTVLAVAKLYMDILCIVAVFCSLCAGTDRGN